jgi:transaldolase
MGILLEQALIYSPKQGLAAKETDTARVVSIFTL